MFLGLVLGVEDRRQVGSLAGPKRRKEHDREEEGGKQRADDPAA